MSYPKTKQMNLEDGQTLLAAVDGKMSDLKSAFDSAIETVTSKNLYNSATIEPGYIDNTNGNVGSPTSTVSKHSDYIPVTSPFTISVDSILNTGFRYAIYNSNKTYISGANLPTFTQDESGRYYLTVSDANVAYLRFSDKSDRMLLEYQVENGNSPTSYEAYFTPYPKLADNVSVNVEQVGNLENRLESLESTAETVDELAETVSVLETAVDSISTTEDYNEYITDIYTSPYTSGYMPTTGIPASSGTMSYTDKISVQPGDVLYGQTTDGTNNITFRFVCAYSGDTAVPSKGNGSDLATYTVPDGIDGVVVSQRDAPTGKTRCVRIERVRQNATTNIKSKPMGYMSDSGDISDGEELHVSENNVKNNVCVVFSGNITTFNKLYIGQRNGTSWQSCYLEIDSTNVIVHTDQGNNTYPHGLTIGSDIQVLIETHNDIATSKIAIYSDGNAYVDTTPHRWLCDKGYSAVLSDGSVLTDCVLSWTSRNINNPVWIFGDSYVSLYDVRWVYWMLQAGFEMPMVNGFAGENSSQAMISLKNLLECRKPQYILWALGMNDGDSSTAVNASWKKNYDIFVNLCKQYGITPILATIPSVPTINNSFKSAIVRESGYRFIDFAKAVDPDADGNWIAGALSTDGIHPTVTGAKILFMRAIADFPELMSE